MHPSHSLVRRGNVRVVRQPSRGWGAVPQPSAGPQRRL